MEKRIPEVEGEKFFNHFEASNWTRAGGVKIQKWKSAFATWVLNYHKFRATNNGHSNGGGQLLPKSNPDVFLGKWSEARPPLRHQFHDEQSFVSHTEAYEKWKRARAAK